jgi:hypothetical protein
MGPFVGREGGVHEGSQRVPALVRYPRALPAGTVSAQVATTFDWTATLLAAAGVSPDPAYPLDGIDLLPLLAGAERAEPRPRQLFWRIRGQRFWPSEKSLQGYGRVLASATPQLNAENHALQEGATTYARSKPRAFSQVVRSTGVVPEHPLPGGL